MADIKMTSNERLADFAIVLLALAPIQFLRAFVLLKLWAWFVMPLGANSIRMGEALGLSLLISLVTYREPTEAKAWSGVRFAINSTLITLAAWGFGAIYAAFR